MYNEEFDNLKTKMLKYIMYKKRTEKEIRQKFSNVEEQIVDEAIEYLKEAGYINDLNYIERAMQDYININTLSIKEIKYKLMSKGIDNKLIENYIYRNVEMLQEYEEKSAQKIYNKKVNTMEKIEIYSFLRKKGYREDSIKFIKEQEK